MMPGSYTVQLDGRREDATAPLTVLADPHSLGTPATLQGRRGSSRPR